MLLIIIFFRLLNLFPVDTLQGLNYPSIDKVESHFVPGNSINGTDTIYWDVNKRLTWNDFHGSPTRFTSSVALTSSGIGMTYRSNQNGEPIINISCTFFCESSWVKEEGKNDSVLQHEQLHFDITELYARKLRQSIERVPAAGRKWQIVQKIYNEANAECDKRQNQYDVESYHGIISAKQQAWNKQIAVELQQLNLYTSTGS